MPIVLERPAPADRVIDAVSAEALLRREALRSAILDNTNFPDIATDAEGVIRIRDIGAKPMLVYTGAGHAGAA